VLAVSCSPSLKSPPVMGECTGEVITLEEADSKLVSLPTYFLSFIFSFSSMKPLIVLICAALIWRDKRAGTSTGTECWQAQPRLLTSEQLSAGCVRTACRGKVHDRDHSSYLFSLNAE